MATKDEIKSDLRPILKELLAGGMWQAEIAREIGLSRAAVCYATHQSKRWMPSYETGQRLMILLDKHRAGCRKVPTKKTVDA